MTHRSTPELLVLHAVRLNGFADGTVIAEHAGVDQAEASWILTKAEGAGWIQHLTFADLHGWSLTDVGKAENERCLAVELAAVDKEGVVACVYSDFLPLNARLLKAITDWQIKPTATDRLAPNDHSDLSWNRRILDELAALGRALAPLTKRLAAVLTRFNDYSPRYESALRRAEDGEFDWVAKTNLDSCHRVWFQLHEDLIATLGIDRAFEP